MKKLSKKIIAIFEIFLFWYCMSIVLKKDLLPNPVITLETTFTLLITSSQIWIHVLVSLYRVMLGILLGTVFSIPMGMLLGYSKRIEKYFGEAFDFLYMIPKIVFLPIFFVLLGIGDLSKIALIATVLFFQQTILIRDNVKNISEEIYDSIRILQASFWQIIQHVVFPSCLSGIFTSVKSSLGISFALLFITENFASQSGLGYFITKCMDRRDYVTMYAAILILAILGCILYTIFCFLERKICKWKFLNHKE